LIKARVNPNVERLRQSIVFALLVVAIAGSAVAAYGNGARPRLSADDRLRRIDEFVWEGALFMKGHRTLPQVRRLPTFRDEKIQKAANPHVNGQTDEYRTLRYEGLEVYGLVTPSLEFRPIRMSITTSRWKIRDGLVVGTSPARIARVLGPPTVHTGSVVQYQGETERVSFHVENGIITKIEFLHYAD
jgi:hypothetical protein